MKHTTQYLFGIETDELKDKLYPDALQFKKDSATKLLYHLVYDVKYSKDNDERISKIQDAIKHTEDLIKEMRWKK